MGPVVGIDLGTTNTVVAVVKDGQAAALADENGEKLLPSVVSFHPNGNVVVGRAAKERRLVDARNTIYSIKRLIGRAWDSEEVRKARARFPFEMREGPGQAALVVARGETYTLPEISAFVLRKAKSAAEAALGTSVDRAVITVPANFNDLQRAATKVAGRVAGLEVLRILNEPTAAALAYGYGKSSTERLAVYDFGGGTFDITLLDLSDNVFEVLATAGNTFLGGDDIDVAIAEKMADEFLAEHRYDPRADAQAFEKLRASAELVKMRLSAESSVTLNLGEVAHGPNGKALGLNFSMSRTELERLVVAIVDRTFDVCREALGIARLEPTDFDQVLLVGGSARIPVVKRRVEEFFKRQALGHVGPDEVVAIGAAIQASALAGAERRRAEIPAAPRRASRPSLYSETGEGRRPPPLPKRGGTLPPGVRPKIDTNPFGEAPTTQPFERPRMLTSPGLQPGSGAAPQARGVAPFVVQPPGGAPTGSIVQADGEPGRQKQTTGVGLGAPPPQTTPGLGRVRAKTGPGLGSSAEQARAATITEQVRAAQRTTITPSTATLMSASEAAQQARRAAEDLHLPLVGTLDEPTLTKARDDIKREAQLNAEPAPTEHAPRLSPEDIALKYGELPLVRPNHGPGATAVLPPLPLLGRARRTEGSVPAWMLTEELEEDTATHTAVMGRPMAAPLHEPAPAEWRPGSSPALDEEESLPIPDIPFLRASQPGIHAHGTLPPIPAYSPVPSHALEQRAEPALPPLLVDVTPLTLSVETVSGYCDALIERNTPVPCERTRLFVTATDNQTIVRVRISQGQSGRFHENTLLGELELNGLRPAPRGGVTISVSFGLDTDGILNVKASDVGTGRATSARVRLVGLPDAGQVSEMIVRQQAQHVT